ncbi:hypothetical protein VNI00_012846 [Paramarasmius palmivorus]|uniref:F-box domain-containing protein n=1 Tax=Paramarasmius palmivorus TaxID=297713 RepID=A0AAW0C5H3_9AGAR
MTSHSTLFTEDSAGPSFHSTAHLQSPLDSPELLDQIFDHLDRPDWHRLSFVSHFFRNVARRRIMNMLIIRRPSIQVCRDYITTLVHFRTTALIRHVDIDVTVSMWEIAYHLLAACSPDITLSLAIRATTHTAPWESLATDFVPELRSILPNITTLVLKPVDPAVQFALLEGYSAKLVQLTLHSSITQSASWEGISFPSLEDVELIEDYAVDAVPESLPLLFAKYAQAPRLTNASLIGVTEMNVFAVRAFLSIFGRKLETVKVVGSIAMYGDESASLPPLPNVHTAHFEMVLVPDFLSNGHDAILRLPSVKTIVLQCDWVTMETDLAEEVEWTNLKRSLEGLLPLSPRPTLICGYRAVTPVFTDAYRRLFIDRMRRGTGGWNISSTFTIGQELCSPLYQTTFDEVAIV